MYNKIPFATKFDKSITFSDYFNLQKQHDKQELVLDKFREGLDSMTPLDELPDIRNEAELKFNKNNSFKLANTNNGSSKNVNSTEKK